MSLSTQNLQWLPVAFTSPPSSGGFTLLAPALWSQPTLQALPPTASHPHEQIHQAYHTQLVASTHPPFSFLSAHHPVHSTFPNVGPSSSPPTAQEEQIMSLTYSLSILHILSHLILRTTLQGKLIPSILWMKKLRQTPWYFWAA